MAAISLPEFTPGLADRWVAKAATVSRRELEAEVKQARAKGGAAACIR